MDLFDKLKGIMYGLVIGDSLGVPHEFKSQKKNVYTGLLYIEPKFIFRYVQRTDVIGQYSDDTEMTLCNLRSIVENKKYCAEKVVLYYQRWANTSRAMGTNTKLLFHGVKTYKGYQKRFIKTFCTEEGKEEQKEKSSILNKNYENSTQSNGCLMRCAFLSFMEPKIVEEDCRLSNPNQICVDSCLVYTSAIRFLVFTENSTKETKDIKNELYNHIIDFCLENNISDTVTNIIKDAYNKKPKDITGPSKGHVINALYCAFYGLWNFDSYQDAIDYVVNIYNSDTDTNGAVTGALYGSFLGFSQLEKEEKTSKNIQIIQNLDTTLGDNPRPDFCLLKDIDIVLDKFVVIIKDLI